MEGWIKLHRKIQNHWLFEEKREMSKLEAWITILMDVNHCEKKVLIKGKLYQIKSGESVNSLDTWAKRFRWNKSKVRRFMNLLQTDNMIVLKSDNKTTHLTVCNYDSYQVERHANDTETKRKRNANETQTTPNKNVKKEKNDNNDKNTHLGESEKKGVEDFENETPTKNNVADYQPPSMMVKDVIGSTSENSAKIQNDFQIWFEAYDKNVGLEATKREWSQLTTDERQKALEVVNKYVNSAPKRFRKKPANYLMDKAFNDEIINRNETQTNGKGNKFNESIEQAKDYFAKGELGF